MILLEIPSIALLVAIVGLTLAVLVAIVGLNLAVAVWSFPSIAFASRWPAKTVLVQEATTEHFLACPFPPTVIQTVEAPLCFVHPWAMGTVKAAPWTVKAAP